MSNSSPDILICGGTSRAGLDAAELLAADGYKCIVGGRKRPDLSSKEVQQNIVWEEVDFSDKESVSSFCDRVTSNTDYKIGHCVFFQRSRSTDLLESIQVSLVSSVSVVEALEQKVASCKGSITFIGSILGEKIGKEQTLAYHVSKGAVGPCVRYLAVKYGGLGIRVNAIMLSTLKHSVNAKGYGPGTPLEAITNKVIPTGRPAESSDVVNLIKFLMSSDASAITAQELHVDGGLNAMSQVSSAIQVMD